MKSFKVIVDLFVFILRVDCCLFQVGFMNDGKIVAADIQFFANSGNTVDESPFVSGKRKCCSR